MSKHETVNRLFKCAYELVEAVNAYGEPLPEIGEAVDQISLAVGRVLNGDKVQEKI